MSKLFAQKTTKNIDVIDIDDLIAVFIQDDNSYPSKIVSIKLNKLQAKSLISKIKYRLKKLEVKNG